MTTASYPLPEATSTTPHAAGKPYLTIKARRGWNTINVGELWTFRDLLWSLTVRDVKVRYKQTALGVIWVVLQPLVAAAIFSYVFGKLLKAPTDPASSGAAIPIFLYTFVGMVAWNLFAGVIGKVSGILLGNSSLVSKVYFPRLLLPLSGGTGALVDLGVGVALLLIMHVCYGVAFTWGLLAAPVALFLVMSAALGIGMWAAALCVRYRDVGYIVPVMIQFLLFMSPIAYSTSITKGHWAVLYQLNPLAGLLGFWRWTVLGTSFPAPWTVIYAAGVSLALLGVGALVFRRMERTFADVI